MRTQKETSEATTDINILIERDLKYLRRQNAKLKNEINWLAWSIVVVTVMLLVLMNLNK